MIPLIGDFGPTSCNNQRDCILTVVECALGWKEGLILLADAGYDIHDALWLALYRNDLESVETLLSCDSVFTDTDWNLALCQACVRHKLCTRTRSTDLAQEEERDVTEQQKALMRLMVDTVKARRESLFNLALTKLPVTTFQSLGLDGAKLLDADTKRVTKQIEDCLIPLPRRLRAGSYPVFHCFNILCPKGGIELADMLYDAGFRDVDAPDSRGETPLDLVMTTIKIGGISWSGPEARGILWLVNHGASLNLARPQGGMSLLHCLASIFDGHTVNEWDWEDDKSLSHLIYDTDEDSASQASSYYYPTPPEASSNPLQDTPTIETPNFATVENSNSQGQHESIDEHNGSELVVIEDSDDQSDDGSRSYVSTRSSTSAVSIRIRDINLGYRQRERLLKEVSARTADLTDDCSCYCSTSGCSPVHKLPVLTAKGHYTQGGAKYWRSIDDDMYTWTTHCSTTKSQEDWYIKEACRLETFERLGMAHTCCRRPRPRRESTTTISDELRQELQMEDAESQEQLEFIMTAFDKAKYSRSKWTTWRFWDWWWDIVDEILPPLLPWERGTAYCTPATIMPKELKKYLHDISCRRHERVLERAGYEEEDFLLVIQAHLGEHLRDVQSEV